MWNNLSQSRPFLLESSFSLGVLPPPPPHPPTFEGRAAHGWQKALLGCRRDFLLPLQLLTALLSSRCGLSRPELQSGHQGRSLTEAPKLPEPGLKAVGGVRTAIKDEDAEEDDDDAEV